VFLAQVGMTSGPKFIETVQQTGAISLAWGAAIVLVSVLFNLIVRHFIFWLNFDGFLGAIYEIETGRVRFLDVGHD
jgi:putative transport protein